MPRTCRQSLLGQTTAQDDREWYFAFCENHGDIPKWQQWFVRKDPEHMQHVYAFSQSGACVLFVEPSRDKIDFVIKYPEPEFPLYWADITAKELVSVGHTVVRHKFIPKINDKKSLWNWIPTCVTVVKVSTGFPSSAWTPKHLFEDLIEDGAELIRGVS